MDNLNTNGINATNDDVISDAANIFNDANLANLSDAELQKLQRNMLRILNPCVDLVEKIVSHITDNYIAPMRKFVKEQNIQEPNALMMNLTKLICYIGRDFIAVEYLDDILSKDERELLEASGADAADDAATSEAANNEATNDNANDDATNANKVTNKATNKAASDRIRFMVQTIDYSDTELSVPEFICKVLGLNLTDYNPTVTLTCVSHDVENLFLPTNDAALRLVDLGYDFTAEESTIGFNSGFISFDIGTFHRLINCRFHYVENDNLKTRIARWIDFYPCKYEEEELGKDKFKQHFQCCLPALTDLDTLWKQDVFYSLPLPRDGKYSKLPIINRFVEVFGDEDNKEPKITSFLAERNNAFILLMTFAGIELRDQLICKWQDESGKKDLKPDFFIIKSNKAVDIVEFKLPRLKNKAVVGRENRETFSADINSYIAQVSKYAEYFDDSANRKWFEKEYGFKVYKPKKILVLGRRADLSTDEWREIKARYTDLDIYTYDDLVDTSVSMLYLV